MILLVMLFLACNDELGPIIETPENNPETEMEMEKDTMTIISEGSEKYLTENSDYLYDQEKLPTFYLELSKEDLYKIESDPAAEEYVPGTLIFEGDTISPVGIRYKGSIGAFVNCLSGTNWADPSGFKTCTKLSMKIKINWEGRTDNFYGLKKLQFHAMNLDQSQLRDRFGYWLFRKAGVPAPRAIHARLVINGEYNGLFALIEQVDGRFTENNWADGDGNLYKEKWPLNSDNQAFAEEEYLAALKTNEDTGASAELIRSFGTELSSTTESTVQSVIEKYMDIQEALSYCVVDRLIRHDDGPFHWYCDGNQCNSHNFYWYEEPADRKLHLIAWDLDNAFENITSENIVTNIADDWGESRNDCKPFRHGLLGLRQKSAACDRLTGGWAMYTEEYEAIKQDLISTHFSETEVNNQLDTWMEQIRAATKEANELHGDAISIAEWEAAVSALKAQIAVARLQ